MRTVGPSLGFRRKQHAYVQKREDAEAPRAKIVPCCTSVHPLRRNTVDGDRALLFVPIEPKRRPAPFRCSRPHSPSERRVSQSRMRRAAENWLSNRSEKPCGKALGAAQNSVPQIAPSGRMTRPFHRDFTRPPLQPSKNIKSCPESQEFPRQNRQIPSTFPFNSRGS